MIRIAILSGLILIAGCNVQLKDPVQDFIPGTYARHSEHEYGKEFDTLIISVQNRIPNEYSILRKWKYERVLDGERLEPEFKQIITTGIYNAKNKLLQESQTLAVYTFDPDRTVLFAGKTQYKKVK